jgi:uncharacterized repeat protein (TIGR04138 family)
MAPTVFREWGVERSEDIGSMVFQLVEAGQLSARPEDTIADFAGGPDLSAALSVGLELGGSQDPPSTARPPSGPGASP